VNGQNLDAQAYRRIDVIVAAMLGLTAIALLASLRAMMLDDAFITYSFARNLARTGLLRYHPDNPFLSTSAPLYAILLGLTARPGLSIPTVSNALSAASIFGSSFFIYLLFRRHQARVGGFISAALIVTSPLLWLSLGLETCWLVFLICSAFYFADADRPVLTGLLLGLAVVTRADALIAAGLIAVHQTLVLRRRIPWKGIAAFLLVVLPFLVYLLASFGSLVPTTLDAKQAQNRLGISGFYVDTSLLEGLVIMSKGWWNQSRLYVLMLPMLILGVVALPKARWAWATAAWGVLHLTAYVLLGVTPYFWYYAPFVVTLAAMIGLGLQLLNQRIHTGWMLATSTAFGLLLLFSQLISLQRISAAITGPLPANTDPNSKVLPGSNGLIYQKVGEWLNANTPSDATVGVTEVGIIGYYADRQMVDFLGVLWPDVAHALQRRDLYYSIPQYMPDYLTLGPSLSTFGLPLAGDEWFLSNYRPVETIEDPAARHEPIVILRRTEDPADLVEHDVDISVGNVVEVNGYAVEEEQLRPGKPVRVRVDLLNRSEEPHRVKTIAYLNGPDSSLAYWAESEGSTGDWPVGEPFSVYHLFKIGDDLPTGIYQFGIRIIVDDGLFDEAHHLREYEIRDGQ